MRLCAGDRARLTNEVMKMTFEEVHPGQCLILKSTLQKITVLKVEDEVVTYRINGVLSFAPLQMPLREFEEAALRV